MLTTVLKVLRFLFHAISANYHHILAESRCLQKKSDRRNWKIPKSSRHFNFFQKELLDDNGILPSKFGSKKLTILHLL